MPPTPTASAACTACSRPTRPAASPATTTRARYNAAQGAAGLASAAPPRPGDPELRIHDRQQPERAALVVGELERARPPLALGGPAPRDRAKGRRRTPGAWPAPTRCCSTRSWRSGRTASLVVGRGVPPGWLRPRLADLGDATSRRPDGHRADVSISSSGRSVSLTLRGAPPAGPVLFQLPSFIENIASASAGTVDQATGTVTRVADRPARHGHPAPHALSATARRRSPPDSAARTRTLRPWSRGPCSGTMAR